MLKWVAICGVAWLLMSTPMLALAATQYITDELTVPLRRGPSNGHKIIHAGLPSGTALEIVGEDKAAGFSQVRTPNGTEGWVPTQYLANEPIARDKLAAASKRIESLTTELTNLRQGIKAEQTARNSAEGASTDLGKQVKQLQTELGEIKRVSANAVATYEENKALKAETEALRQTVGTQAQEIRALKGSEVQIWLLSGGGLVVLGLVFGIVLKTRPKRRNGW
jgi:SH3 domain protein